MFVVKFTSFVTPQVLWSSATPEDILKRFSDGLSLFVFQRSNPSIFAENIYHHEKISVAFIPSFC